MSSGENAPRAAGCSVRKSANVYTVKYRFSGSPNSSLALQMLGAVYLVDVLASKGYFGVVERICR